MESFYQTSADEKNAQGSSGESVTEVGSSNPVRDFEQLLRNGESLIPTAQQLEQGSCGGKLGFQAFPNKFAKFTGNNSFARSFFIQKVPEKPSFLPLPHEQVVEDLIRVSYGTQMYSKITACLCAYRSACLAKGNPDLYNDFLREFRHILNGAKKQSLMLEVAEKDLGLISRDEHRASHVGPEEAKQFLN